MSILDSGDFYLNVRIRLYLIFFAGIVALASVLYWRFQLLNSAEYVEIPIHSLQKKVQPIIIE